MVYGRYNYSFHGVYKPTNITGGHHPASNPWDFPGDLWSLGLQFLAKAASEDCGVNVVPTSAARWPSGTWRILFRVQTLYDRSTHFYTYIVCM